jgi:hypothetical protein
VVGAQCRDTITGRKFEVHAKVVINAAGEVSWWRWRRSRSCSCSRLPGTRGADISAAPVVHCCGHNTTGPWVDSVRHLSSKGTPNAVTTSSGAHVTLPEWYGASGTGMIVPKTRVRVRAELRPHQSCERAMRMLHLAAAHLLVLSAPPPPPAMLLPSPPSILGRTRAHCRMGAWCSCCPSRAP